MSNTLLNISTITKETLMELKNQLSFSGAVNRQYDEKFAVSGAKVGTVINIRKPVRFTVTDGPALEIQNIADQSVALTLDSQKHVGFQFSSKDLTLSIDEFKERYLKPAVTALANKIDYDGTGQYLNVFNSVGTPGTAPTTLALPLAAGVFMDESGAPVDDMRSLVLPSVLQSDFVTAGLTLYNDQAEVSKQYKRGKMGVAAGFNWKMDQNMRTHSTGAVDGAPQVKTTISVQGATTIAIDTITTATITGAYKAGDTFTIGSVFAVNPQSKQSTGRLMQFVVTADANAATNEVAALSFTPAIYSTGQYQNVDSLPQDNALVKTFNVASSAASSKVSPTGLAFHRDAFVLGMADLELPGGVDMAARASDPDAGLSIRIVRNYDINNDVFPCRLDVLYGWKTIYPELACRVQR
ncbi:MAG: P22 phage major capsid protein family protein [Pseudomonadota bacterium]